MTSPIRTAFRPMTSSASHLVLTAKLRQIEELRQLAFRAELVAWVGRFVHALQAERGASSIYLASSGSQYQARRLELLRQSEGAERDLRACFEAQSARSEFGNATLFSLMAWVALGMDALPALREQIAEHRISADESVLAFSRLIAGLLSLIFEVADSALDPSISRQLVALFNLVQGKEFAGQERAVGAISFASGRASARHQQKIRHLIDAQERNVQLFCNFADRRFGAEWEAMEVAPFVVQLERLRRVLCSAEPGAVVATQLSDAWFDCSSARISGMWQIQEQLVTALQQRCAALIAEAEADLADTEGLLQKVQMSPPASAELVERFLGPQGELDARLGLVPGSAGANSEHSLIHVMEAQSTRLAKMEAELDAARRALQERKAIERAKGMLMARFSMSEEAAYKTLRKTSMEQNRRIAEVAEATLSVLTSIEGASSVV